MESFTTFIFFTLLIALILLPILILFKLNRSNQKSKFILYLSIATIVTSLTMILLAWWSNKSDQILLSYYGYNIDGMNEAEFYEKVSEKKIERVKELQRSLMGIGWPLKAIMSYIYYFPYLLIAYLISYLVNKPRKKLLPKKLEKMK